MWRSILVDLYGAERASEAATEVEAMLDLFERPSVSDVAPLSERDTWLIVYPDQFMDGVRPPLTVLCDFLDTHTEPWIRGVHVLPFYPWSSDDGFAVKDYCEVDEGFGDWNGVTALAGGRRLMVDAVINHMSAESDWFRGFLDADPMRAGFFRTVDPNADLSETVRPRTTPLVTRFDSAGGERWLWTTFSSDQVDLDYRNPKVLLSVLGVLLEYVRRGATALRLDAVGFLWKEEGTPSIHLPETHRVIQFLRSCLDEVAPATIIVTETNVPHAENVSYLGDGVHREAQLVYQFPLAPLILDALLHGDTSTIADWLSALSTPVPGTSFLNFLASHDGVGVRPAEGLIPHDRVQALADLSRAARGGVGERTLGDGSVRPYELNSTWFDLVAVGHTEQEAIQRHLATHAVMLALAGVPLVYIHSLFGSSNDHDGAGITGRPRSLNRRKFEDVGRLEEEIGDPSTRTARVYSGIREMIEIRAAHPAFHPSSPQRVVEATSELLVIERGSASGIALVVVNVSGSDATFDLPAGRWVSMKGRRPAGARLNLAPWSSSWLRAE